jgi:hypothetical protein
MADSASDLLASIRTTIPDYPGYVDERGRLQSDRLVRAWVGSCFADLRERLASSIDGATAGALDDVIFRSQFPDQRYVAQIGHATISEAAELHLMSIDKTLLSLAQDVCVTDGANLMRLIAEVNEAYDNRTPVSA